MQKNFTVSNFILTKLQPSLHLFTQLPNLKQIPETMSLAPIYGGINHSSLSQQIYRISSEYEDK